MTSIPPASEPLEPVPAQSVVGEGSTSPAHELLEFNVEVTEAAELLGVSRTRLSQLTSKGIFSFERRKIDSRNRLFYSKHELLQYLKGQRGRISGATSAGAQFQWSPSASPMAAQIHSQNISHNESEKNPQASLFSSEDVQNLFLQAQEVQALKTQFQISRQASLQKAQRNPLLNLHSALELSRQDTALENWNGLQKSLSELQQQQLDLSADIAKQWNEFLELKKNLRQATQETAKNRAAQVANSLSNSGSHLQIQHGTEILIQALGSLAQSFSSDKTSAPASGLRRTSRHIKVRASQKVQLFR